MKSAVIRPPQGGSALQHSHEYHVACSDLVIVRWCTKCGVTDKLERCGSGDPFLFASVWSRISEAAEDSTEAEQNPTILAALQAQFPQHGFVSTNGGYVAMRLINAPAEELEPARIEIAAFIERWKKEHSTQ